VLVVRKVGSLVLVVRCKLQVVRCELQVVRCELPVLVFRIELVVRIELPVVHRKLLLPVVHRKLRAVRRELLTQEKGSAKATGGAHGCAGCK
jgi:hypothetical protein